MSPTLTTQEQQLVMYLEHCLNHQASPPSFEEIRCALGLTSKDHVARLVDHLETKGYVRRQPNRSRSLVLERSADGQPFRLGRTVRVPLLGFGPASFDRPIFDGFGPERYLDLTRDLVPDETGVYALLARGDSLIDANIHDGDIVVLRQQEEAWNGDLVQVWVTADESVTVKRWYREGKRICLKPENTAIKPRYFREEDVRVQGKVILVIHRLERAIAA